MRRLETSVVGQTAVGIHGRQALTRLRRVGVALLQPLDLRLPRRDRSVRIASASIARPRASLRTRILRVRFRVRERRPRRAPDAHRAARGINRRAPVFLHVLTRRPISTERHPVLGAVISRDVRHLLREDGHQAQAKRRHERRQRDQRPARPSSRARDLIVAHANDVRFSTLDVGHRVARRAFRVARSASRVCVS